MCVSVPNTTIHTERVYKSMYIYLYGDKMPEYGMRLLEWFNENRYAQGSYVREISPIVFGCGDKVIDKYIVAALRVGKLVQKGVWLHISNLERINDEIFPWEKKVIE